LVAPDRRLQQQRADVVYRGAFGPALLGWPDGEPVLVGPVHDELLARGCGRVHRAVGLVAGDDVASDDNAGAICNRLGVRWWQLEDPSGERLGTYPMLYPGDVITIIATDAVVDKREATNALC
jgi:hypothetical protein